MTKMLIRTHWGSSQGSKTVHLNQYKSANMGIYDEFPLNMLPTLHIFLGAWSWWCVLVVGLHTQLHSKHWSWSVLSCSFKHWEKEMDIYGYLLMSQIFWGKPQERHRSLTLNTQNTISIIEAMLREWMDLSKNAVRYPECTAYSWYFPTIMTR